MAENTVKPDKLRDYALATALLSPLGQSAYHRRQQALTIATAGLAAGAVGLLIGRLWTEAAAAERLEDVLRSLRDG